MPRRPQVREYVDWTGGLNYVGDAFTLAQNEVVDCLNVTLLPRGGFQRRKTVAALNETAFSAARNVWPYYAPTVSQILVQDGNNFKKSTDGSTFTAVLGGSHPSVTGRMRAATLARQTGANPGEEICYIQRNSEQVALAYDGTSATPLGDADGNWNDNTDSPQGGYMPQARFVCTHAGFLFHANIFEGGAQMISRVRFSHPNEPEDYRADDTFDVGGYGEPITGLASFGRNLYIFKRSSVWVLSGYTPDTFQLIQVTDSVGAVSQEAVCVGPNRLFFFDEHDGVYAVTSENKLEWLWQNLSVLLGERKIPAGFVDQVTCGWMSQRLWVSVPWLDSETNMRMFVFDPLLGRQGGWYQYAFGNATSTFGIGPMVEFRPQNSAVTYFGLGAGGSYLYSLDHEDGSADVTGDDSRLFSSLLQTAWYKVGVSGAQKRFRRPRFVLDAPEDSSIDVTVLRDFEPSVNSRSMSLAVNARPAGGLWGDLLWGSGLWGANSADDQTIVRGRAIGSAYAVSFVFNGEVRADTEAVPRWGVNAIDLVFLPKAVR